MSNVKKPSSLRGQRCAVVSRTTGHFVRPSHSIGAVTAVCLAATTSTSALAQSSGATDLPPIEVETTQAKPKKKSKAAKKKSAPSTAQAAPAYEPAPPIVPVAGSILIGDPAVPGGNPYAQEGAPYKINQSANSKLTEPLVDTPKTVTTISKEVLEDTNTTSIRQLARSTPGITLGYGEGGSVFGDNLYIRGFKANNDAYIDGVRDSGTTSRETFMTEQVEILKGPSSSVGGRGTTGGAVNVVTKKPQGENFQNGSITLGTDETVRTTVDVNHVFDPTFAVRANGMWQDADVAGRDFVYDDRWGAALSARWTPTRNFSLTADYYHIDLDQLADWGVPFRNSANGTYYNAPWPEFGVDRSNYYGIPDRDFQKGKQDVFTLTNDLKFSEDTWLTSKFRRSRSESDYIVSAPGGTNTSAADPADWTVSTSAKSNYQVNDVTGFVSDLTHKFKTGFLDHTVVTGVEVLKEDIYKTGYQQLDTESFQTSGVESCTLSLFNPTYAERAACWSANDRAVRNPNGTDTNVLTKSAYILDTIEITPQWIINGGVRLDDYDIERDGMSGGANPAPYHYERQDTMFNWNAGIVFKPAPNGSIYGAVSTSTNPMGSEVEGGGGFYGGLDENGQLLDPEKNTAYEVGTKWEFFDRRLLATAALFQTEKDNAREDVGPRGATVTDDTGKYRIRGFEASVAGKMTDRLSLFGGFVIMDSEVIESANVDDIGKRLANISHTSFNLLTKYEVTRYLTVGGQATYQSPIFLGSLAENGRKLPDAWTFDLLAEYAITQNVELQLNVNNVFDEVVYDSGYRSGSPFVYIAPGRAAYATLNFKY